MKKLILILALLALIPMEILLLETGEFYQTEFQASMADFRQAAGKDRSQFPLRLNAEIIAEASFPQNALMAGETLFKTERMIFAAWQIVYADKSILIDTAHDAVIQKEKFFDQPFYPEAYSRMQQAMKKAAYILVTHEHLDHVGGIARSANIKDIAPKTMLTKEQLASPKILDAGFTEAGLSLFHSLEYSGYYSPSPGIVLLKAPGHSPGSQFIYVALQNGKEYLFVGDIAWNMKNIQRVKGRPYLVSRFMLQENRPKVAGQLEWLHTLGTTTPLLNLIVAHDAQVYETLLAKGEIRQKFE